MSRKAFSVSSDSGDLCHFRNETSPESNTGEDDSDSIFPDSFNFYLQGQEANPAVTNVFCTSKNVSSEETGTRMADASDEDLEDLEDFWQISNLEEVKPIWSQGKVKISLSNRALWDTFNKRTHEMFITETGRKMIPSLAVAVHGLDKTKMYCIYLEFAERDNFIWKLEDRRWKLSRKDVTQNFSVPSVEHPDSPAPGRFWLTRLRGIEFKEVLLTNDPDFAKLPNSVYLRCFQAYQPIIKVVELDESRLPIKDTLVSHSFPQTAFVAVPAYET